jgi:hypothetical protein
MQYSLYSSKTVYKWISMSIKGLQIYQKSTFQRINQNDFWHFLQKKMYMYLHLLN